MYRSKALGKNNFHFFVEHLKDELDEKIQIELLMKRALEKGYFKLFYQPKVEIETNKIVGCEALIRLIDPEEGFIPPDKFIHIAEDNGFIIPLGEWVIEEASKQLKAWEGTSMEHLKLSINGSSIQFGDHTFYDKIAAAIEDIDATKFDIELTESILMDAFEEKLEMIHRLKSLGLTLSLDDFGIGYSSLSYLKKIPFNTLKIDKSFIDDLEDRKDQSFVNMIITIARELELDVVAEGVGNEKQLAYLKSMHCTQYQGYYCSRPLPVEEFELFVKERMYMVSG
jgi:EAL domain-containing protein (putative c-di-GMP-specific phosphodiesterase class I)